MKMLRGYLVAAIIGALTWVLMQFGERFSTLVDMVYPYVIRTLQGFLATWSGGVDFLLWQVLAVALGVLTLGGLVIVIVMKWNPISWAGWVLAGVSFVYLLHTAMFGLNYYAGPIGDDIRLDVGRYSISELAEATEYYRDKAEALAPQVDRDENGNVKFDDFQTLAGRAGDGFQILTYEYSYPIFAGSTQPVKQLGWANWLTKKGVTGITIGLTGEAGVNPNIPDILLPFAMSHEMAHRMCIATEEDANFAAFLAGHVNESIEYQYSAYFMAYRYCYTALVTANNSKASAAAARVNSGVCDELYRDMNHYNKFFSASGSSGSTSPTNLTPDENGFVSYGKVTDMLVCWHIQQIVLPSLTEDESPFDPYDPTQVDISGIVNAKEPTEATEGGE